MFRPAHIQRLTFFYAVGNTPAVCLTQSIPHDEDAKILLLGCGDIRSLLYTAYAGSGSSERALDFTCCDLEAEILARNILILTMIIDDAEGKDSDIIWSVYYDIFIESKTLDHIRHHTKRLIELSNDGMDKWAESRYGRILRFCSTSTFLKISNLWKQYHKSTCEPSSGSISQMSLKKSWQVARQYRQEIVGGFSVFGGIRSAAPCSISFTKDSPKYHRHYWDTGASSMDKRKLREMKRANPLFGTAKESLMLHYGTDPLFGAHLATAYISLDDDSPLRTQAQAESSPGRLYSHAKALFKTYCSSFRQISGRLVVRSVYADAIAFCHVLQQYSMPHKSQRMHWYRDSWHFEPLILDSPDYSREQSVFTAPVLFNIIDTSNLVDHVGCLNVLAATAPLLISDPFSTICTEILLLRSEDAETNTSELLCADLQTVALLFGLSAIQCWTDTNMASAADEKLLTMFNQSEVGLSNRQSRSIMIWKHVLSIGGNASRLSNVVTPVHYQSKQLASLMFEIYLKMFQDESWSFRLRQNLEDMRRKTYEQYTRASLVVILKVIKHFCRAFWDEFFEELVRLIFEDRTLNVGAHYFQELLLHLEIMGLYKIPSFQPPSASLSVSPFRNWSNMPSIVCLTMSIPRSKVALFEESKLASGGTPAAHIMLQLEDGVQSIFPDIQLGFGIIKTTGIRLTETYAISIDHDEKEWIGTAPLIVSVLVPSWIVTSKSGLSTMAIFALKSTPLALHAFIDKLGMLLEIHTSALAEDDVHITMERPNLSIKSVSKELCLQSHSQISPVKLSASLAVHPPVISHFMVQLPHSDLGADIGPQDAHHCFKKLSPFSFEVSFESGKRIEAVHLPVPLKYSEVTGRSGLKSAQTLLVAPVISPQLLHDRSDSLFPVRLSNGRPCIGGAHFVNLQMLPMIDIRKATELSWLNYHLSCMFSDVEREQIHSNESHDDNNISSRTNFRNSLYHLFVHFTGIQKQQRKVLFGINCKNRGGLHILLLASCLRLDSSNQTVLLDGAVVVLRADLVAAIASALQKLTEYGIMTINVNEEELLVWKNILPVFAERCRDWQHRTGCEYQTTGRIPLSTEFGERVLCSCGEGKFPKDFRHEKISSWQYMAKYAVRVAIPLVFDAALKIKWSDQVDIPEDFLREVENFSLKEQVCFECSKTPERTSLNTCSACKVAKYCSRQCQAKNWKQGGHKKRCKALQKQHT